MVLKRHELPSAMFVRPSTPCVSWKPCQQVLGYSRTMCPTRSAPLNSVAQCLSGLFGHADLTPSDLMAALVGFCLQTGTSQQ